MHQRVKYFGPNENGRDFVVGDIHGELDKFVTGLNEINFDYTADRMFSVGDLVDRGPNSFVCLKLIHEPWFNSILGNHEIMMLLNLTSDSHVFYDHPYEYKHSWIPNGGEWVFNDEPSKDLIRETLNLPYVIVINGKNKRYNIVHAEFPMGFTDANIDAEDFNPASVVWDRNRIYTKKQHHEEIEKLDKDISEVYVGHTPLKEVTRIGKYTYIDTGACFKKEFPLTIMELKQ